MQHKSSYPSNLSPWKHVLAGAALGALMPLAFVIAALMSPLEMEAANIVYFILIFGVPLFAVYGAAFGWGVYRARRPGTSRLSSSLGLGLIGALVGITVSLGASGLQNQVMTIAICTALPALLGYAFARR